MATAEAWAPTLEDVGRRIPTRTRDQDAPGSDDLLGTFNGRTVPTGDQVQPVIDDAVAGVRHVVGTVTTALEGLAADAAAWRAAADVELAYPERDGDIRVYDQLNARAKLALDRLTTAADDAGSGADATLPVWSMPDPPPWGDDYL